MQPVLDVIARKVTTTMNDTVVIEISADEVKDVLFEILLTKAHGLNGFLAHFFSGIGICVAKR
jgi:hypothetical protein